MTDHKFNEEMTSENNRHEYENKICPKEGLSEIQNLEATLSTQTKGQKICEIFKKMI
jgi:hypothetical protein